MAQTNYHANISLHICTTEALMCQVPLTHQMLQTL